MAPRYAIYYSPPVEHPLTQAGARWLGRDAFTGQRFRQSPDSGAMWQSYLAEPRRYGFHATLKAPFRLRGGVKVVDLECAMEEFAVASASCPIGKLKIALLDDFLALIPLRPEVALGDFAARVTESFDTFRAPLNEAEIGRRLKRSLDATEMRNLVRWGYPHVFDRFRFHMTLCGPVPHQLEPRLQLDLETTFKPMLDQEYAVDALTLFVQAEPGADFVVRSRFLLRGRAGS